MNNVIYLNDVKVTYYSKVNLRILFTKARWDYSNFWCEQVIYAIVNNKNGKIYIGQAKDFFGRFGFNGGYVNHLDQYQDYLDNGGNKLLFKAFDKYKFHNFTVYVIDEADSQKELNKKESYWITKLNTCIYDTRFSWGYNMTWGGEDASQLHTPEAVEKRWSTIAKKFNGDFCGQLRTPEAIAKAVESRRITNMKNYNGDPVGMLNTPEAVEKRNKTIIERFGYLGAQLWTPESRLKADYNKRKTRLFDSINGYIDQLISDGAEVPITWDTYWNWSDGFWNDSNFRRHIRHVLDFISDLRSDPRWTDIHENIFSEVESNRIHYGI